MIDLKHVLVPIDFSPPSDQALRYGCEMANNFGAELHLLHVVEQPVLIDPDVMVGLIPTGEVADRTREMAHERLEQIPDLPSLDKLTVHREIRSGAPFLAIIDYAKEKDIDLIVVGSHGRGMIAQVLLGRVAELVVRKAPCPVLTVRAEEHEFIHP